MGIDENFFDLGGDSLLLGRVRERIVERLGRDVTSVELFTHPTIRALARHLQEADDRRDDEAAPAAAVERGADRLRRQRLLSRGPRTGLVSAGAGSGLEIAVVGLACRFPGALNPSQFWDNLRAGRESIRFFTEDELVAASVSAEALRSPDYVRAYGALDAVDEFDAAFFGINPKEAELMDPQHRLLLECAWEAMESCGCAPQSAWPVTGIYAGGYVNTYRHALAAEPGLLGAVGPFLANTGNEKDYLVTRIAYKLDLTGPAVTVQTACSTSLVAVQLACQALLGGACDLALAGGVTVRAVQRAGYLYQPGGIFSPDEAMRHLRCSTDLDAMAGAGVVVENVTERWDVKRPVYERLDRLCAPGCVLAANTSTIPITQIASATRWPDRVIGMHFMNPVERTSMVEVIRGQHTSDETLETARELLDRMGKECVVVGDAPGFVTNRVLMLTINEAICLVHERVAAAEEVDRTFRGCFGHPMGPLETADLIGLDTILQSVQSLGEQYRDDRSTRIMWDHRGAGDRRPPHGGTGRPPEVGLSVYRDLREAIVSGHYQPNERLVEADLTQTLGASRTTVRAALVRLDQEGLVELEANRGAQVRLVSEEEALEIEEARMALEQLMTRKAAVRLQAADLAVLRSMLREMSDAVDRADPLAYAELDSQFHRQIWAVAGHAVGIRMLTNLKSQSIRFQYRTILQAGRPQDSLLEHRRIVDALASRDPDASEAVMRDHLMHVIATLKSAVARHRHAHASRG